MSRPRPRTRGDSRTLSKKKEIDRLAHRAGGPLVLPFLSHVILSKNYADARFLGESGCKGIN